MCSKHLEAWNKLILKQKFCASSWLITEINILRCTVSKTSKMDKFVREMEIFLKGIYRFRKDVDVFIHKFSSRKMSSRWRVFNVTVNREEFLKWRKGTWIPVKPERERQHFKTERTELKNNPSRWSLLSCGLWSFRPLRKSSQVTWS